ncbi:MAG: hypothetical protein RR797_06365 [Christensenella sp.]
MLEFIGNATDRMTIREQVLIALWAEYQRDLPCLAHVKCNELGIGRAEFDAAYAKLDNEGLLPDIRGLCLNEFGLSAAADIMPFGDNKIGYSSENLEIAAQIAEHHGAPLLSKFICSIAHERAEKYKTQLD